MTVNEKLSLLREIMTEKDIQAVIIPSNDAHQSEYVPTHWKSREWISGFTGSAGTVVITLDKAGLWTDGRYYTQGKQELSGSEIELHEMDNEPGPQYVRWLTTQLESGDRVSIDGNVCSIATCDQAEKYLDAFSIDLITEFDLIHDIWKGRKSLPLSPVFVHEVRFAGKSTGDKLAEIRLEMESKNADHHLITTLDDIAWTFNLRGSDVEFNPVFLAYAVISKKDATIFIDGRKVSVEIADDLREDDIYLAEYDEIINYLDDIKEDEVLLVDRNTCSIRLYNAINCDIVYGTTIPRTLKAIKNKREVELETEVMAKDCRALAKTFYWIEQSLKNNNAITEHDIVEKLIENRAKEQHYIGESFNAIVGYKGNGAIIHYRPDEKESSTIKEEGILLCDSGGQYLDGTTDITRTFALGTPSKEEKRNFTLVLKGMIALTQARFPEGTTGGQLDTLARQYLWENGLNFAHGTGHGVGFFLNVHEPPQGFAPPPSERGTTAHEVGMVTSNEPGFYKVGEYGIRIENLIVTEKDELDGFLKFKTLTLYPIDIKMIDEQIMSSKEKAWLNNYHHDIWEKVGPLLEGEVKNWFELKCRPLN